MWVERHAKILQIFGTLLLKLCALSDLQLVYSQGDDPTCSQCKDEDGKPCNDVIRRFSNSRFWVMKGDKTAGFNEAVEMCQRYGFVIAEINSEAEESSLEKLGSSDSRYWLGFVKQGDSDKWTKLDLTTSLTWQAPIIEESDDFETDEEGKKAISADTAGVWYSSAVDSQFGILCQFPPTSHCYRGVGKKPETPKPKVTQNSDCPEPEFEENQMIRTGPGSKFLYPKTLYFTSSAEATVVCTKLDLEPATVTGKWEYKHLVQFIFEKNLNNSKRFFRANLGAVDNGEGLYEYSNQESPQMNFQAFNLKDKEYFSDEADCLAIEWFKSYHYFIPVVCDKESDVMPLCQYRSDATCTIEAPLEMQDADALLNKMLKIGDTAENSYYGAMKQKTWAEAVKTCEMNKLKLLKYHKGSRFENNEILTLAKEYRTSIGLSAWNGFSWLSGRSNDSFEFNSVNGTGNSWKWNDKLTKDKEKEKCLVLTKEGVRPVLCDMTNYFMCYTPRPSVITTTSTPKPEPTTEDNELGRATSSNETNTTCFTGLKKIVSFAPGGLTEEDILGLIKTAIALNFSDALVSESIGVKESARWRIRHVAAMGAQTKAVCRDTFIQPEFIHLITNFIIIYYNSIEESNLPENRQIFWRKMERKYMQCQNDSLNFTTSGGLITEYEGEGGNINVANEKADKIPVLDYMLEGLWYMFELTAVTCFKSTGSQILWLSNYFTHFRKDFTDIFKKWWVSPGDTNYGVLFGDMDLYQNLYNLRACAVACFQNLDVEDLLFVRPVDIDDGTYVSKTINKRT